MSFRGAHDGRPARVPPCAIPVCVLFLALLPACSGVPQLAERVEDAGPNPLQEKWDDVAVGREPLRYPDLPGFPALERLEPDTRERLVALANREPCPCECGHSVAYCVNEVEGCLVSRDWVREHLAFAEELDENARELAVELPEEKGTLFSEPTPEVTDPGEIEPGTTEVMEAGTAGDPAAGPGGGEAPPEDGTASRKEGNDEGLHTRRDP